MGRCVVADASEHIEIKIDAGSALAQTIEAAGDRHVVLLVGDKRFEVRPERWTMPPLKVIPPNVRGASVWARYDPERVRKDLREAAGGWRDIVDGEALKTDIREQRLYVNRPEVRW